jgi:hypothetical protein
VSPDDDGIATLVARLDALTAHAIRAAIDSAAQDPALAGDCAATAGERRAEALAALVLGQVQVTAQIDVLVPVDSLTGTDDDPLDVRLPLRPIGGTCDGSDSAVLPDAALPDGTLIPWESAQSMIDDPAVRAQLRRLLVDAQTGTAIDLGRSRYEVSEPLRRWISARDRTCRFPGCRRRATACQVDHIDPWDDGGRTDADNLQALCTRHHQLKTHCRWRSARDPDTGRTHWISPLGRTHVVDPEPVLVPASGSPVCGSSPPEPDPPPF